MRNIFIKELIKAAEKNKKIVLIVGDLGYGVVEPFKKRFPNRFYNAGVAEQSMMGIASGLALRGFHVFVYSIANFPTFRCAEQIRNDIDYHKLNVTIVSVGSGLGYGNLGYSHHGIQDYALMRSFPNMLIASPSDNMELKSCMRYIINNSQPFYLRLDKSLEINKLKNNPDIYPGKLVKHSESQKLKKNIILSTGSTIKNCIKLLKLKKFRDYDWYSIPMWGMKIKKNQFKKIIIYKNIITVENHLQDGGFGSWVGEIINSKTYKSKPILINKFLNDEVVGKVGSESYLDKLYGPK